MYLQVSLEGKLEQAFLDFCRNNNFATNSEAFRAMIRSLPEYQKLEKKDN